MELINILETRRPNPDPKPDVVQGSFKFIEPFMGRECGPGENGTPGIKVFSKIAFKLTFSFIMICKMIDSSHFFIKDVEDLEV